eukprot:13815158-Alexandrium_andersonii.AAC.1
MQIDPGKPDSELALEWVRVPIRRPIRMQTKETPNNPTTSLTGEARPTPNHLTGLVQAQLVEPLRARDGVKQHPVLRMDCFSGQLPHCRCEGGHKHLNGQRLRQDRPRGSRLGGLSDPRA